MKNQILEAISDLVVLKREFKAHPSIEVKHELVQAEGYLEYLIEQERETEAENECLLREMESGE
jgi:hypothetical protein